MDDAAFRAMFHGDVLIGVSGGPSAPLEPVLLRSQAAQRDVFCWKRGETTASPQQLFDFNGMNAQAMHERALAMLDWRRLKNGSSAKYAKTRELEKHCERSEAIQLRRQRGLLDCRVASASQYGLSRTNKGFDHEPENHRSRRRPHRLADGAFLPAADALGRRHAEDGAGRRSPLFFVLTNTRGMDAERAAAITREVCENLKAALADYAGPVLFVSRSDSTLRGHYPVETDVMNDVLGPFDATLLTPAFFEGGRITRDSTHYLMVDGKPVPTHETEFARDSVFGYTTAFLPDYVAEKTGGRVAAEDVARLTLADLRAGAAAAMARRLARQHGGRGRRRIGRRLPAVRRRRAGRCCRRQATLVPQRSLAAHRAGEAAAAAGRRRILRHPGARPAARRNRRRLARRQDHRAAERAPEATRRGRPAARRRPPAGARAAVVDELTASIAHAHARGLTPVVFTSRAELQFASVAERLAFGEAVSATLMDVVKRLPTTLGFLISKGGITSNDVLSTGLALAASRVLGQILPGVTVVQTPPCAPPAAAAGGHFPRQRRRRRRAGGGLPATRTLARAAEPG
jgi:uncharacterized protein YgbK (DUF1537 family)